MSPAYRSDCVKTSAMQGRHTHLIVKGLRIRLGSKYGHSTLASTTVVEQLCLYVRG